MILLILAVLLPCLVPAQVDAYFSFGKFTTPKNEPFVETYLTIVGKSLAVKSRGGDQLQNSVTIEFKVLKDSIIVKANKYNLMGPVFLSSEKSPTFIDNQRYALPNGVYEMELTLTDNYDPAKKPLLIKCPLVMDFDDKVLQSSSIQPLESFKKSIAESSISKSGYDLVPYPANLYPESTKELNFYYEVYNANLIIGEGKPFVFSYYLEVSSDQSILENYGAFKKQTASKVNPLLARMDITKLPSGNYDLVIDLKDANNVTRLQKKFPFQRVNMTEDIALVKRKSNEATTAEYFGHVTDLDTLKMFVECLWPIAGTVDKERIINQSLRKNEAMMKNFMVDFWERRAGDTANPVKLWANYYKEVQKVMILFKCGKQKGYYSDRGRVYLQYGAPNQRSQQNVENNTFPYEIWQYYKAVDGATGVAMNDRRFVFVNKMLGDDCFMMIHSDMRGEVNNPRWQFELTRRNNQGMANPDNNTPSNTQFNQFNEIYSNPR
ncbi:hypothetical protein CNR22_01510 [Sphingobacteriaceae bacterium]|nr:hypothetical protein CNR22_01510 [Sphingobacteriaceae bacterium]